MDELRIVLLGKQGAGKSASGNTILHKQSFHTAASSKPVTEECLMITSEVDKQTIKVIDTPGWCDDSSDVKQEIIKCINMSSPGPHVFLLVLPIGRFTNEEIRIVMNILKEFGDEVNKYMIVLFTKGDDLEDIEDYLKEVHPDLKKIIKICGERYHVFNNRDNENDQVSSLLKKINEMVERNEEKWYTTAMYQKVKDQQMDDIRRQQFRTEADNSVQDQNKSLSERENRGRGDRHDAEGDDGERKSISKEVKLENIKGHNISESAMEEFQNSIYKIKELIKEKYTLVQEINELEEILKVKNKELEQKGNNLELQRQKLMQYEINDLIKEEEKKASLEILKNGKKTVWPSKGVAQMEEMLTKQ